MIFYETLLSWFFYVWACTYFCFHHCGLHSLKSITQVIFISLCVIMWKTTIENIKEPKNKICIILFSGFLMFFWQFCLVMLKMVTNCFGNRNFMYLMKRLKGGLVFLFWIFGGKGDREGISFVFSLFPICSIKFPKCSQCVP